MLDKTKDTFMMCPNCKIQIFEQNDGSFKCPNCVFVTFNNLSKLTEMYACISVDCNGNEGIIAYQQGGVAMPLVCGSPVLVDGMRTLAIKLAKGSKIKVKMIKFTNRMDLEEFGA